MTEPVKYIVRDAPDSSGDALIDYTAEATPALFHASDAIVRGICGSIGSGKTAACCFEIFKRACAQRPYKGVRYSRWAVIRNTASQLETTIQKEWMEWFDEYTHISGGKTTTGYFKMDLLDETKVDLELIFIALDRPADRKKLKSIQFTAAFINEAIEIDSTIFEFVRGRTGRFPPKRWGVQTWSGVILDTNPPDDDHWYYAFAEEDTPEGWEFYRQPPALLRVSEDRLDTVPEGERLIKGRDGHYYYMNPLAENVVNQPLGADYWLNQVPGARHDYLRVFLTGEYGTTSDGKPVYQEYQDDIHCADHNLVPMRDVGISIGFDFGRTPACVISQITPMGQKRVLDEIVTKENKRMGIRKFSRDVVVPHLLKEYRHWIEKKLIQGSGDPAGINKTETDEVSCFKRLNEKTKHIPLIDDMAKRCDHALLAIAKNKDVSLGDLGIRSKPARTNAIEPRLDAVDKHLMEFIDDEPMLLISPKCRILRKGFRGKYMMERLQVGGDERYKETPFKNHASHVHDALQYDCMTAQPDALNPVIAEEREKKQVFEALDSTTQVAIMERQKIFESMEDNNLGMW